MLVIGMWLIEDIDIEYSRRKNTEWKTDLGYVYIFSKDQVGYPTQSGLTWSEIK